MALSGRRLRRALWFVAATALAVAFFWSATAYAVYRATSPPHLATLLFCDEAARIGDPLGISLHVVLRKLYSVVAFALVCGAWMCALRPSRARLWWASIVLGAVYSAAIEVAQAYEGSTEGLAWNAFDVVCGALGGALAAAALTRFGAQRTPRRAGRIPSE